MPETALLHQRSKGNIVVRGDSNPFSFQEVKMGKSFRARAKRKKVRLQVSKPSDWKPKLKPIPNGMEKYERQKKEGLYIAGFGYLRRITKLNPTNMEVLALKLHNPKDKPFQHLSLKGIENFFPFRM
jgi:hypothetical protein